MARGKAAKQNSKNADSDAKTSQYNLWTPGPLKHFDEPYTLAVIRDALLLKLLPGEIRVKQAERIAEEVA